MTIPGGGYGNFTYNTDGSIELTSAVPATANRGLLSIGAGPWDGASAGHFAGAAVGTAIAVNAASGYAGDFLDLQLAGVQKLAIDSGGIVRSVGLGALGATTTTVAIASQGITITNQSSLAGLVLQLVGYTTQTGDLLRYFMGVSQVGRVRADGLVDSSVNGLATKQKAGVPVDGDWAAGAPPNGTLVVDSTDSKLYVRVGGAWKGVVVA